MARFSKTTAGPETSVPADTSPDRLKADATLQVDATAYVALAGVGTLVFGSGFAGLVLQVAWFREFALVFGGSAAASAAVLAIFMGGLGAGSALWGSRVDRQANPLRCYAHLTLLVGLTGALSGYLIDASRVLYIHLGGQSALGLGGATLTRLGLAAAVLAVPTVLMGGTLPAAVKAATRHAAGPQRFSMD